MLQELTTFQNQHAALPNTEQQYRSPRHNLSHILANIHKLYDYRADGATSNLHTLQVPSSHTVCLLQYSLPPGKLVSDLNIADVFSIVETSFISG
jgi:hypothetical protein